MYLGANGSLCASLPFKRENNEINIRRDLKGGLKRKALLATSALVPVAMANLLFSPEAEAVTLDRDDLRELPELDRILFHAVNAVEWEIDEETGALKVLFDDGWGGVFDLGEYIVEGDALFLWPENIFVQAYPVHAVWNILWGHPAGAMAGGGIWWLMGRNDAPVAVDDVLAFTEGDNQGDNAEALSFNVLGDDYDENNDTISLLPFADVTGTFGRFTMNAAGTDIEYHFLDDINATNLAEGETGTDTARYQIQDEHGLTDTATLTVTVTGINKQVVDGNEPSAKPKNGDMAENGSFSTNLLENASDADGGVPFISAVAGGTLGEAVAANGGGSFTITANGAASFDPGSDFDYLDEGDTTTVSIGYTVSDGRGSTTSSTVTITIIGENDPISDGNESYTDLQVLAVTENESISSGLNVLNNVSDKDADDTKHVSVNDTKISGTKTYSGSKGGTFTLTADGAMTFDPGSAFDKLGKGATTTTGFTYEVTDGDTTDTSTVTVKVTGVNDAPEAGDIDLPFTEDIKKTTSFSVPDNVSDADEEDTLTVSFADKTGTYGTFSQTANGDIQYAFANNAEAQSLKADETKTETATYTVSDGNGGTDTATLKVTITGVNDAPVAKADFTGSATEDAEAKTITFNAVTSATDVDAGTSLTLSSTLKNETSDYGDFVVSTDGKKVEYKFADDDEADKLEAGEKAKETVTYTIKDGKGGSDSATITVTITGVNDAPTVETKANDIALQDTETGNDAVFLVPADGGGYAAAAGSSIDLAFDDVDDVNSSLTLTASGLPDGLTYNDGSITGTAKLPDPLKAEKHTVTVTAKDDGDADGSNKLSANDELDIYIGLNISANDGNIEPGQSYTIEGSDVADDSIDPNKKKIGAGAGNEVTIDLGDGINYFKTSFNAASDSGKISYTGGDGSDEVKFLQFAARNSGEVTVDAGDGDNTLYLGNYAASNTGSITYTGGTGEDGIEVNFFFAKDNGTVTFDLGDDTASDQITFKGSVADKSAASNDHGTVTIQNFDPNGEDSLLFTYEQQDGISPATLDFLEVVQSGQDVIIRSPESVVISNETIDIEFNSPLYVYLTVENASTSGFDLSLNSDGDLLIN